jgi:ankyrin repeat protein
MICRTAISSFDVNMSDSNGRTGLMLACMANAAPVVQLLLARSYRVKYLRISSYMRKPFLINDFATDPVLIS